MTRLERLKLRLEQLLFAEQKITATPKKNDDGTYVKINGDYSFIQGSQIVGQGDTTYTRVRYRDLVAEIARVEKQIEEIEKNQKRPKNRILGFQYA
jgi:predicted esterase